MLRPHFSRKNSPFLRLTLSYGGGIIFNKNLRKGAHEIKNVKYYTVKIFFSPLKFTDGFDFYTDFQVGNYFLQTLKALAHRYLPVTVPAALIPIF